MTQKIQSLTIRNFKGIANEKISMRGNSVYVLGRNAMGKTSFLDAIFKILSGKDMPSKPTREGARSGSIEIELNDINVSVKFNEKNEKYALEITNKEGEVWKSPRTNLNELVGAVDFNIDEFFHLTPAKQVEKIKQLTGIDFTELDADYKKIYDERTFTNRKIKELEAQQKPFDKDRIIPIDILELQKSINIKRDQNKEVEGVKSRIIARSLEMDSIVSKIESLQKEVDELLKKRNELEGIQRLAEEWLASPEAITYDITEEEKQFAQVIEDNKLIEENIKNKKLYEDFIKFLGEEKEQSENLERINETKKRIISEADMPAPGLSFNEESLTYNGLPFEASQINKAQQIIIGLQMQKSLLGDVKIARFDGSLIDNENMEYIEDWAVKNGLQLFVEIVDRTAEQLKIIVKEPA